VSPAKPRLLDQPPDGPFVALDFETADYGPDSACQLALVRVEADRVVRVASRYIRPPRKSFVFTYLHGIAWHHVADEPPFAEVWADLAPLLDGATFLAAHNAGFDRGVLRTCCEAAGLVPPTLPWLCTVKVARKTWKLKPANLAACAQFLQIPLKHHDAGSDAEACARIVIAARRA
jgi:DNA polymerase-3 subunit epsilon